ncbi:MAG: hypothetical protein ABIH66_13730 [bacterium]
MSVATPPFRYAIPSTRERSPPDATASAIAADVLFLIGLPHETPKTVFDTIRFAKSLNAKLASFSNAVPFPGTKMREMGRRGEGGIRLLSSDWTRFERHMTYAMELETVSLRRLKFYHFLAYLLFYFTPGRIVGFSKKANIFILPRYLFNLFFQS